MQHQPSPSQIRFAIVVAFLADTLQLPRTVALLPHFLTRHFGLFDAGIGVVIVWLLSKRLGFKRILLFAFVLELLPRFAEAPIWTATVAYIIWRLSPQPQMQVATLPYEMAVPAETRAASPEPVISACLSTTPSSAAAPGIPSEATTIPSPEVCPPDFRILVNAVAESSPTRSNRLPLVLSRFRGVSMSKEAVVIAVLVIPALLFAVWLLHGIRAPKVRAGVSRAEQLAQIMLNEARHKVEVAKDECDEITRKWNRLTSPGPEPEWYHPIDHWNWSERKEIYEKLSSEYSRQLDQAEKVKRQAEEEFDRMEERIRDLANSPETTQTVRNAWTQYVVPPLHIWFAFSLFRFAARSVFRFLLFKDRIGAIHL